MWTFRKRKLNQSANRAGEAAASSIANAIIRKQLQLSAYLERKTQHWNKASKLTALCLFCLLFGGFSLWLLIKAFY